MCQLLGMNCNTPSDICFSFEGFRSRGGLTDVHTDGLTNVIWHPIAAGTLLQFIEGDVEQSASAHS